MEVAAAKIIWERSKSSKLRYVTMLSDGDSKAYDAVAKLKPYGEDKPVCKEECINHVAKRMTAALENLKKSKQKDGISLGGRGMLTATMIKQLHSYYHRAIKQNAGDVSAMKKAIMATPYHITSTDDQPDHRFCPDDDWCWYRNPKKSQGHRPDLPKPMLQTLLPVYERLSEDALLERCSRVSTQNANESLNGLIWRRCPKVQYYGRKSVQIASVMGVMSFNSGVTELNKIKEQFGLTVGRHSTALSLKRDERRKKRDIVSSSSRKDRHHRKISERQRYIQKEGVTYAAGRFGA